MAGCLQAPVEQRWSESVRWFLRAVVVWVCIVAEELRERAEKRWSHAPPSPKPESNELE